MVQTGFRQGEAASPSTEAQMVHERYAKRMAHDPRYSFFNPAALYAQQERQRAMLTTLSRRGVVDLGEVDVLEVGCGDGGNLLEWLRLGCHPERLMAIELLEDRHAAAREKLPSSVRLVLGDATAVDIAPESQDVVQVSTVFSSLLDDAFQHLLARRMWSWLRPGGGVLWYDFTVDNPRNPDVRGVPLERIRALFPEGIVHAQRITLAPPIARWVTRIHPTLYTLFNALPPLRTHVLVWIGKN